MANLIADYSISILKGVITLKDNSTANYGGENIVSRKYVITYADGTSEDVLSPTVNGVGDETTFNTTKDYAFNIGIVLVPDVVDETSVYEKANNVLSASFTDTCLLNKRRNNILNIDPKNILSDTSNTIEEIEKISSYYNAAVTFISLNDLMAAQEAIDISFALCNESNCGC